MVYVFFRAEGFYPIDIPAGYDSPAQIADHAELNPGTLRIEDAFGRVVWPTPTASGSAGE